MAGDLLLKIDDLRGESIDAVHTGAIEIVHWEWGMSQSGTAHSGLGAGAGRAQVHDVVLTKYTDRSSPNLIKMCCSGKHFSSAALVIRKAGGSKPVEFARLRMQDGIVSSFKIEGRHVGDIPFETIQLNFAAYTFEYTPQSKDGSAMGTIPASWNIAKNAPS
jgi:type VI secretion system secreted protein Hcp